MTATTFNESSEWVPICVRASQFSTRDGLFGGMLTQDIAAWKMKLVKLFKSASYYTQYLRKSEHDYLNMLDIINDLQID